MDRFQPWERQFDPWLYMLTRRVPVMAAGAAMNRTAAGRVPRAFVPAIEGASTLWLTEV